MSTNLTSPVTGGAQTGATAPIFVVSADSAPDVNARAWKVDSLSSGTFAGVRYHSVSDPFTVTMWRPKVLKTLPSPNAVTGRYAQPGSNVYSQVVRKGVNFAANQSPLVASSITTQSVPAGADAYDAPNVRAMVSMSVGVQNQLSAGIGDTCINGSLY